MLSIDRQYVFTPRCDVCGRPRQRGSVPISHAKCSKVRQERYKESNKNDQQ